MAARSRANQPTESAFPIWLAGASAAVWAVVITLLSLIMLFAAAWTVTADPRASMSDSSKAATSVWLLANSVPINFRGATIGLTPLLLSLCLVVVLYFAFKWATVSCLVHSPLDAFGLILAFVVTYAACGAAVSLAIRQTVFANTSATLLGCTLWASLAATVTLFRNRHSQGSAEPAQFAQPGDRTETRPRVMAPGELLAEMFRRTSRPVQIAAGISARITVWLLIISTAVCLVTVILNGVSVIQLTDSLSQSGFQTLQMYLLFLLYLPTLIIWCLAILLGPGISVGGSLSLFIQTLGPMPTVPFLAVLPAEISPISRLLLMAPIVSIFLGFRLSFSKLDALPFKLQFSTLLTTSVFTSLSVALLSSLASGSLGTGRFKQVGPDLLQIIVVSALWVFVVSVALQLIRNKLRK